MFFSIKENHFDPYNVLLAIATNIPQQLKTGFVVHGHNLTKRQNKTLHALSDQIAIMEQNMARNYNSGQVCYSML